MKIFSREIVNSGRQIELDLLRGFTAIDIIIGHVGLYLGGTANKGLYILCDIFGSEWGAPVFMALMGICIVYSRHQKPAELFKRGIFLLIAGYALSFWRSILPLLIFGPVDEWASIEAFFVVDIFQFAGLSFMLIALLKKLKLPNAGILAISVLMVILDQIIMLPENFPRDYALLTGLVNLFCPVTEWSCFPLLTWFFFPALGLVFGDLLMRCSNKKRLYGILLPAGLLGIIYVYVQFYLLYPDHTRYYWGNNYYYMGLKNVLLTVCFIVFAAAFWFFASKGLPVAAGKYLAFLSQNLDIFYVISWLIISVLIHLQALHQWQFNTAETIGLMVILLTACTLLAKVWVKMKARRTLKKIFSNTFIA